MTKVSCRQRQCSNWERGGCAADEIAIDHEGICVSQDEGESLAAASEKDWDIEESLEDLVEVETEGDEDDWEEDGWLDEDEDDADDGEDDDEWADDTGGTVPKR